MQIPLRSICTGYLQRWAFQKKTIMNKIPYIPKEYIFNSINGKKIWFSESESESTVVFLSGLIESVFNDLENTLNFHPKRALNVCCYHNNYTARASLQRLIPDDMALAPFANSDASLVVVQSPRVSERNGDDLRMKGILTHEFTHIFSAEATGSKKILGDGNANMRIPTWLNEGYAEILRCCALGQERMLEDEFIRFGHLEKSVSFQQLNEALDGLTDEGRTEAFKIATAFVWEMVIATSIQQVFQKLVEIGALYDMDEHCCIELLSAQPFI